jgi:hypothetical protein
MISCQKLFNKPNKLIKITGLTISQYQTLIKRLKPLWNQAEHDRLWRLDRKRSLGAGRKYRLNLLEDKLLVILLWYRTYPVLELLEWIFNLDATNIGRLLTKLSPLLEISSDPGLKSYLPKINQNRKKVKTWEEFTKLYPDIAEVIIDATEQKKQRPVNKRKQRNAYSGKKHTHTLKTQITVTQTGKILNVSHSYPGRIHDKGLLDKERTIHKLPRQTNKRLDKGYDGIDTDHPDSHVILPYKRRRNSPVLTRGQKQANGIRSRRRLEVEHVFCRLKKYRILADTYRSDETAYNQHFRNIAALCNFRQICKPYITS